MFKRNVLASAVIAASMTSYAQAQIKRLLLQRQNVLLVPRT